MLSAQNQLSQPQHLRLQQVQEGQPHVRGDLPRVEEDEGEALKATVLSDDVTRERAVTHQCQMLNSVGRKRE